MLDFEHSVLGIEEPRAVARQSAERNIDQIRRDIYESHRHRAFSLAYYMTGNELAAEDLLARCFTRAFSAVEAPNGADVDASLLEELRTDGVLEDMEPQSFSRAMAESGAGLEPRGNILRTDLEEALGELAPGERLVFLLGDVEGYSAATIATLMGKPVGEICSALMGARLRLRQAVAVLQKKRGRKT